ncbi:MAG: hypothetical protein JXA09_03160 [Anaerolineae bacterium]|nr:hypothetical protein [Anaerolineae bacterium]
MGSETGYRDRRIVLGAIGVLLLGAGITALIIGPLELHCFYLFSEGGRHHYPGFRFGTFMYGNIAAQVAAYYLVAAVGIPLGYGHLAGRRWTRVLVLALAWCWFVIGMPLSAVGAFMLFSAKALSIPIAAAALVLLALSYLTLPVLLLRFYRGRNVTATLARTDPRSYWVERLPMPVLVLCLLYAFYILAMHAPMFLGGVVPVFGALISGLEGIAVLDLAIVTLGWLLWGMARLKRWAWWGSLAYFVLLATSVATLARYPLSDLLAAMRLPPTELQALGGLPLHGVHLALLIGVPLLATLGLLVRARRCFARSPDASPGAPDLRSSVSPIGKGDRLR